jgi:cyclopropane-fatty-acyl-phospholipid synthase
MSTLLAVRPGPAAAAAVLREVFGHIREPFAFRLWDGTDVRLGQGDPPFTVVFTSPEVFGRLMRDPSPGNFAEAYVSSGVDIEGDLFRAMSVANAVEGLELGAARKLRLLWTMWRGRT